MSTEEITICRVCGYHSTGIHYGVPVCDECKVSSNNS